MTRVVYRQIADDLRQQIVNGSLSEGDLVPAEGDLCDQWGTSRGPVRNALAQLRREGLISSRQGTRSVVLTRQARQPVDQYQPFTRWAQAFGRTPGAQTVSLSLRRAGEECAEPLDIQVGDMVVEVVRLRLLDGEPTMLERTVFREEIGRLLFDASLENASITDHLASHDIHFDQVEHEIDAVAADRLDAEQLGVTESSPLLRLRRRTVGRDGEPFEFSDDRYRNNIVRFTVNATQGEVSRGHLIKPAGI